MKFEKVLLRRAYDSGVEFGTLVASKTNNKIFDSVYGEKAKALLDKNMEKPAKVKSRGKRRALIVGIVAEGEVYDMDAIKDYLLSYGIMKIEHSSNKRICIKIDNNQLVIENIEEVFKNKRIYDYVDMFTKESRTKYIKSKDSFLCKDSEGKTSFENLVLKAEMKCQIIKEEYVEVYGTTPDQQE